MDWTLIDDWNEALAARPYELAHFKPNPNPTTTSYSEAWRWWVRDGVTQRNEEDLKWLAKYKGAPRRPKSGKGYLMDDD